MVDLEITDKTITVSSPYHPDFPSRARKLGGSWHSTSKTWTFDVRDLERVKELCRSIFGEDGTDEITLNVVTLRVTVTSEWHEERDSLFLAGRMIARAVGRDSGARLGNGIVLLDGKITSGGSAKYWCTVAEKGTVFELRDVPREIAEKEANPYLKIEILDGEATKDEEIKAIKEQIKKLEARLEELNKK